jgi:ferritin-like protein
VEVRETPKIDRCVRRGDVTQRVAVEQLQARGIDAQALCDRLAAAAATELAAYCLCTAMAPSLPGRDAREACDAIGRASREHFEALASRISDFGGALPRDLTGLAVAAGGQHAPALGSGNGAGAGDAVADSPGPVLAALLEDARDGIRRWWGLCDATSGRDFCTFALAQRILDAKIEQEDRLIGLLTATPAAPGSHPEGSSYEPDRHARG